MRKNQILKPKNTISKLKALLGVKSRIAEISEREDNSSKIITSEKNTFL